MDMLEYIGYQEKPFTAIVGTLEWLKVLQIRVFFFISQGYIKLRKTRDI